MKTTTTFGLKTLMLIGGILVATTVAADEGWYVGGSVGRAFVDEDIAGLQFNADSTSFRVYGGYGFSDHFAVEAGYLDLGTFRDTVNVGGSVVPVSANADGFTIAVAGTLPLSERLSGKARVGFYFSDGQSTTAGITENDPSEENAFVGIGLGYDLSEKIEVNINADYFNLDRAQPWLASVGLTVRF